jgi:phosphate transport system permease protein
VTNSAGNDIAPRRGSSRGDVVFRVVVTAFAVVVPALFVAIFGELLVSSWPTLREFGLRFLLSSTWDPVAQVFGAAPMIYGTVVSSMIALVIAVPLALGVAIYLTEFAPRVMRGPVGTIVELLAAIPSVVYGLWGIFVLIPTLRTTAVPALRAVFGWTPLFRGPFLGNSMLAAGIVLAVMILPYISAISREVLRAVPNGQREAALALGATKWEMVWTAVLPYGRAGITGAVVLGLGRALGETMAVTMLIGNRHALSLSLFEPGHSMAALLANEFAEATARLHLSALFEVGLVLFALTITVNAIARLLVWRVAGRSAVGSRAI